MFVLQCDSETEIEEKVRTVFLIHKAPEIVGSCEYSGSVFIIKGQSFLENKKSSIIEQILRSGIVKIFSYCIFRSIRGLQ